MENLPYGSSDAEMVPGSSQMDFWSGSTSDGLPPLSSALLPVSLCVDWVTAKDLKRLGLQGLLLMYPAKALFRCTFKQSTWVQYESACRKCVSALIKYHT